MSRLVRDPVRPYWVEAYYAKGVVKHKRDVSEQLAIATVHSTTTSRDLEIAISEAREDIGTVNHGWNG